MEDLKKLALQVLDSIVGHFETAGVELPERRYIASGQTAHDCEQVTVSLQQLYLGMPGDPAAAPNKCDAIKTAVFLIEVVRKVPAPGRTGAPTAEELDVNGQRQMIDAYTLLDAGANAPELFQIGVIADVSPGDPSGAFQAMTMNLIMPVP